MTKIVDLVDGYILSKDILSLYANKTKKSNKVEIK